MARPKLDDTLPPGVYPPSGTTGYPLGTGVLDDPYDPGTYPVPLDGVSCSDPIGCPTGVGIYPTPVGAEPTLTWSFHVNHIDTLVHTVRWTFGDGTSTSAPSDQDVEHTYADDGTYHVTATCHAQLGTCTVVAGDVPDPPTPLTLTAITPTTVAANTQVTFTLTGDQFADGMVVRFWDGQGNFRGAYPATVESPTSATVLLDTTVWAVGTGGVDVYLGGAWSEPQLQITISAAVPVDPIDVDVPVGAVVDAPITASDQENADKLNDPAGIDNGSGVIVRYLGDPRTEWDYGDFAAFGDENWLFYWDGTAWQPGPSGGNMVYEGPFAGKNNWAIASPMSFAEAQALGDPIWVSITTAAPGATPDPGGSTLRWNGSDTKPIVRSGNVPLNAADVDQMIADGAANILWSATYNAWQWFPPAPS